MLEVNSNGLFWFPGEKKNACRGRFLFDRKAGIKLELTGKGLKPGTANTIFGEFDSGERISIFAPMSLDSHPLAEAFGQLPKRYIANSAVIGGYLRSRQVKKYSTFIASFDALGPWANVNTIKLKLAQRRIRATFSRHSTVNIANFDGLKLDLVSGFKGFSHRLGSHALGGSVEFFLKGTSRRKRTLEEITRIVISLNDFFTFCTNTPSRLGNICLFSSAEQGSGEWNPLFSPIESAESSGEFPIPPLMLLPLTVLKRRLHRLLPRWVLLRETLKPMYQVYFGTVYGPKLYSEGMLLPLIQVLEGLHRARNLSNFQSRAAFKARIKRVVRGLSKTDAEWVRTNLQHANEPSLRQRLDFLYLQNKKAMDQIADGEALIRRVVRFRHSASHSLQSSTAIFTGGEELYLDLQRVRILIILTIMESLGMSEQFRTTQVESLREFGGLKLHKKSS